MFIVPIPYTKQTYCFFFKVTEKEVLHKQNAGCISPTSFSENEMSQKPNSRSITPKSSSEKYTSNVLLSRSRTPQSSVFSPYYLINEQDTYYDSYDVFLEVKEMGCGLLFATTQQPYVENYYISFRDYLRDGTESSVLDEKKIIMNYGDVLLGIDGDDVGGKHLQDVKYIILCKTNNIVQLTFLNKHWFNNQIRKSVKVREQSLYIE
jgi:hypothetical protein